MNNDHHPSEDESKRYKLEEEIRPPSDTERFRSRFENKITNADNGALPEDLHEEIQKNLDELTTQMDIYHQVHQWGESLIGIEYALERLRLEHYIEEINTHGMTKGLQPIGDTRHLTLPQPPVHDLREMEQLTLLVLDITDEPKSVGEIAEDMAALLRETLVEYLQGDSGDSEPRFVERSREYLDKDEIDQMEANLREKLQSRVQYNLGSLDEKQYITRGPDPTDKRRTIIELTATGELWVETHALSDPDADPIDSVLGDEVAAYVGVEEE